MDADERLTALKKAYADIILNTAKEAAARVMVSERKAFRFQHELFVAKEESVQMMVRLKNIMESKISEAAMVSFSQQKKIEELEAQLQEAEDIVNEVRGELREIQGQLERATKNKERSFATLNDISEEKMLCTSMSIPNDPLESHQYESMAFAAMNTSNLNGDNKQCNASYVGNLELPSIILRSKEPEPYRNGCTQRILAFERNADTGLSLSRKSESSEGLKPEASIPEDEEVETICTSALYVGGDKSNVEKKHEETGLASWKRVQSVKSLRRNRKRVTRKQGTPLRSSRCDEVTKMDQEPYISCAETDAILEKNAEEESIQMGPRVFVEFDEKNKSDGKNRIDNGETLGVSMESSGAPVCEVDDEKVDAVLDKLKVEALDKSNGVPSRPVNDRIIKYQRKRKRVSLSNSNVNGTLEKGDVKNGNGTLEKGAMKNGNSILEEEAMKKGNDTLEKGATKNGNGTLEKGAMKNGDGILEEVDMKNGNGTLEKGAMKNGDGTLEKGNLKSENDTFEEGAKKHGNGTTENGTKKNANTTEKGAKKNGNGTLEKGAKKNGNGTLEKGVKNGNGKTEKEATKRKKEKLISSLETKTSGLLTEPTRDSSRLAQVARQLLSLAEKKW